MENPGRERFYPTIGKSIKWINNAVGFFALLYLPGEVYPRQWMGGTTGYWSLIGLAVFLLIPDFIF